MNISTKIILKDPSIIITENPDYKKRKKFGIWNLKKITIKVDVKFTNF